MKSITSFAAAMVVLIVLWTALVEAYFHREIVVKWFQRLGYPQWMTLLMLMAGLVLLGHWLYSKGRAS
jgi:hypothetical protein